jgi:hypothetical protein
MSRNAPGVDLDAFKGRSCSAPRASSTRCRSTPRRLVFDLNADEDLRAEPQRLLVGAGRQLGAADALRETGVILDSRAGACLATGREAFENDRAQPLGGGVDGSGEPRGAGAGDDDVVELVLGLRVQPGAARQLAAPLRARQIRRGVLRRRSRRRGRPGALFTGGDGVNELLWRRQLRAVGENGERLLDTEAGMFGQQPAQGIGVGIDLAMRHAVACEEGARG